MPASQKIFDLSQGYRPAPGDPLLDFLGKNRGVSVAVSLAALRRLDTLVVQLLLVAAQDWRRRGLAFSVTSVRPDLEETLRQLGVTADLLPCEAAA